MIHSVQKAMQILTVISDQRGEPVTMKEISEKISLPRPTCAHLLATLARDGYVRRISHTLGYTLGPATYYLSRYGRYEKDLVTLARPVMRWMEHQTHATIVLAVIENRQKYIIECFDNEQKIFSEQSLIRADDIYRTATGRVILAQMDREAVKAVWETNGIPNEDWEDIKSYEELLDALAEIKKQGVVVTGGSPRKEDAAKGFACPIFQKGTCVGALGVAWIRTSESDAELAALEEKLCKTLLKGAKEIGRRLLYSAQNEDD